LNLYAMNEDPLPHLQNLLLRRDLTVEEKRIADTWLATHPKAVDAWNEQTRLARSLRRLPDATVPSNFTARVLAEVRNESARDKRAIEVNRMRSLMSRLGFPARVRAWFPAIATTACILVALAASQWQSRRQLAEFRRDVTELRVIAAVPQDVLEDFEAIRRFSQTAPSVDFELLAALE